MSSSEKTSVVYLSILKKLTTQWIGMYYGVVLTKFGIPSKLLQIIQSLHVGMEGRVVMNGSRSEEFDINHGLRQGCVLAPVLFNLFLTAVNKKH